MTASTERLALVRRVAAMVPWSTNDDCVRVAVDGGDGAGKTTFADELAVVLEEAGRDVVRASIDDFHQPRTIRYRRGRTSAEGFWLDSFDLDRLRVDVLDPLGPGGGRRFRRAAHDLASDAALDPPPETAPAGAVLVLDGLFLNRDSLFRLWDLSIWLDVPFKVTAQRMAVRDGTDPDPAHPSMARYVGAQLIYREACDPAGRASIVIDNAEPQRPRLLHTP